MSNNNEPKGYDYSNPDHYKKGYKEAWEMMVDIWGVDAYIAHCEMCAFKYRMRLGDKPDQPVERDLQKAKWYEDKAKELRGNKLAPEPRANTITSLARTGKKH